MLRKIFKIALIELKYLVSFSCSFVTFFLDEKSNQKSQVRIEIIKFLLKFRRRGKNSSASPDSNNFPLNPTTFYQKLEFL